MITREPKDNCFGRRNSNLELHTRALVYTFVAAEFPLRESLNRKRSICLSKATAIAGTADNAKNRVGSALITAN